MNKNQSKDIANYIKAFPKDVQVVLEKIRVAIKSTVRRAEEKISYGIPTYTLDGKNLVHFGGFKNHIGFFPTPSAIVAFKKELSAYKQSKGTVQFPLTKPLPMGLIKKIVKYRVRENLAK